VGESPLLEPENSHSRTTANIATDDVVA
jgi:hypothetical protein